MYCMYIHRSILYNRSSSLQGTLILVLVLRRAESSSVNKYIRETETMGHAPKENDKAINGAACRDIILHVIEYIYVLL
jgi:hypothetical protein